MIDRIDTDVAEKADEILDILKKIFKEYPDGTPDFHVFFVSLITALLVNHLKVFEKDNEQGIKELFMHLISATKAYLSDDEVKEESVNVKE